MRMTKMEDNMKRIILLVVGILLVVNVAWAGLFNDSEGVVDFINKLETKAGYVWYPVQKEYVPTYQASLYTFKSGTETNQFRIGSIDLGYSKLTDTLGISDDSERNIVYLATMLDAKIFETFNMALPKIGDLQIMAGLALGADLEKLDDIDWDNLDEGDIFRWGIPTIGLKFKF